MLPMTSHPLGQVFEAMMERWQDQIPDEWFLMTKNAYVFCFCICFHSYCISNLIVLIRTLLTVIWQIIESTYDFDNNYIDDMKEWENAKKINTKKTLKLKITIISQFTVCRFWFFVLSGVQLLKQVNEYYSKS